MAAIETTEIQEKDLLINRWPDKTKLEELEIALEIKILPGCPRDKAMHILQNIAKIRCGGDEAGLLIDYNDILTKAGYTTRSATKTIISIRKREAKKNIQKLKSKN